MTDYPDNHENSGLKIGVLFGEEWILHSTKRKVCKYVVLM